MTDIKVTAFYDRDTFKTHGYIIEESGGVKGSLYIDKDVEKVPKEIVVSMQIKE